MKRYAVLFVLLLGISSTAFGYCSINVTLDEITCGKPIIGSTVIRCSGTCEYAGVTKTYVDNTLYADVFLRCSCTRGCSEVRTHGTVFGEAACGRYVVVVRVWCDYGDSGCFPYCLYPQPVYCGVALKTFNVSCDDCGCGPCGCLPTSPCCP